MILITLKTLSCYKVKVQTATSIYSTDYPWQIEILVSFETGPSGCQGPTRFDTVPLSPIPPGSGPMLVPRIAEPQGESGKK